MSRMGVDTLTHMHGHEQCMQRTGDMYYGFPTECNECCGVRCSMSFERSVEIITWYLTGLIHFVRHKPSTSLYM